MGTVVILMVKPCVPGALGIGLVEIEACAGRPV